MTRGGRVIAFIEKYCLTPEGAKVGQPIKLMKFQKDFIKAVYDNTHGTSRAYLSIARKNGKSALIACLVLAHVVGPEAQLNAQIISGARSRDQAALVFKLAQKMVNMNPELKRLVHQTPSQKQLTGLLMNVEYRAISAEASTAHGLSPVLAILDEVGQIKGPSDDFVEAIVTSQGAHENPLLIAISTQAATDNDLFSRWIDDAEKSADKRIISHIYRAPEGCELLDRKAWKAANPALGAFRSLKDIEDTAARAVRLPTDENSFRWLYLNQRIEATAPFIGKTAWKACGGPVQPLAERDVIFGGLDLSEVNDLTALVLVSPVGEALHVHPTFWLPGDGLIDRSKKDRVPYDVWHNQGYLEATAGPVINYEFVAARLWDLAQRYDVRRIGFDRWNWNHLKPWLSRAGFLDDQLDGDTAIFAALGQGYQTISPALRDLETAVLTQKIVHANHPVLAMCAANAVVEMDAAGNRKLAKNKARGRIDGMVALAMAMSVAGTAMQATAKSYLESNELMVL